MLSGLDLVILGFIYKQCLTLGAAFGFGAFEGAIGYSLLITLGIVKVKEGKSKKDVKRK